VRRRRPRRPRRRVRRMTPPVTRRRRPTISAAGSAQFAAPRALGGGRSRATRDGGGRAAGRSEARRRWSRRSGATTRAPGLISGAALRRSCRRGTEATDPRPRATSLRLAPRRERQEGGGRRARRIKPTRRSSRWSPWTWTTSTTTRTRSRSSGLDGIRPGASGGCRRGGT
jgi:hypothetical protein